MSKYSLTHLTDGALLRDLTALVVRDRSITALLLAQLAEVDARKLYLPAGYPSMHVYCVQELGLSEDAVLKRIQAARICRQFPALFSSVAEGRLHLSGVCLLAPHLTSGNAEELLAAAEWKSKSDIERLLAERFPRSESLPLVQVIPASRPVAPEQHAPGHVRSEVQRLREDFAGPDAVRDRRSNIAAIARQRFQVQFTISQETLGKLHHVQALLSHRIQPGDLPAVLDRILDLAIERLEKQKFGKGAMKRSPQATPNPRRIPQSVKEAVWKRDGGQCSFVSESGHRCTERDHLEFDHIEPFAHGGRATVENIRLLCRAHNQWAAECSFGKEIIRRKRSEARERTHAAARRKSGAGVAEIIPGLRNLGFSAEEARHAAEYCEGMPEASLHERFRAALSYLRPKRAASISAAPA